MRFQRRQARQWSWSPQGALWGLGLWEQEARDPDCWGWRRGKAGRGWAGCGVLSIKRGSENGGIRLEAEAVLPRPLFPEES